MENIETSAGRFWRWLLPAVVVACLYVNYVYNAHPPADALSNGDMSARHPTLLTPAGYAFSIWGIIFTGLVGYAIWQWLPAQRGTALPTQINGLLTRAVVMTTAWTLVFSYGLISLSLTVMVFILLLLAQTYGRARRLVRLAYAPAWPVWFLSLYLGWIMLAAVLNFIFGLRDGFGLQWSAQLSLLGCYALLLVAVGLGVALAWHFRDALLPLPIAWGLVGTWVAQQTASPDLARTALGAAVALLAGAVLAGWPRQRPPVAQPGVAALAG